MLIVDPSVLSGVGNRYQSEIRFLLRLDPFRFPGDHSAATPSWYHESGVRSSHRRSAYPPDPAHAPGSGPPH